MSATKGREILKSKEKYPDFNFLDYAYSVTKNLNFYNIEIDDNKKKKEWVLSYWKNEGKNIKPLSKLSDAYFSTAGAVAHMIAVRKIELDVHEVGYLDKKFIELTKLAPTEDDVVIVEKSKEYKTEQELKTHLAEFDAGVDMFFDGKVFDAKSYLIRNNVKPTLTRLIADSLKPLLKELKLAASGKDEQLTEAYSYLTSRKLKKFIDYIQTLISSCEVATAITRAARKPRAKKIKAPTEIVKSVKYLVEDESTKMRSIHPSKIINAKEAWLYNAKNRRLFKCVALDGMQLSVKGTTIINIDQEKSGGKIIRKPTVQLKGIQNMTSRPLNKVFNDIRGTMSRCTGRLNGETLIVTVL